MPVERILCVDDEPELLSMYQDFLGKEGYEIKTAQNGFDCGCVLFEFQPDLIILDLAMPEMNGLTAIEYLMSGPHKEVKILVVSGIISDEEISYLEERNIPWLEKPINMDALKTFISEL